MYQPLTSNSGVVLFADEQTNVRSWLYTASIRSPEARDQPGWKLQRPAVSYGLAGHSSLFVSRQRVLAGFLRAGLSGLRWSEHVLCLHLHGAGSLSATGLHRRH